MPTGKEHKWFLEKGVDVFSRIVIFLSKIYLPHMQLV